MSDDFDYIIETSDDGPEEPANRRGRWSPVYEQVEKAKPGKWIVVRNLTEKDASSLRSAANMKGYSVSSRKDEGGIDIWITKDRPKKGSRSEEGQDATAAVDPVEGGAQVG